MSELIKKFDQLYVGFDYRQDGTDEDDQPIYYMLGFATPFEKNAAGAKRRETVDNWGASIPINDDGTPNTTKLRGGYRGQKYGVVTKYKYDPKTRKSETFDVALPADFLHSKIIDNEPLEGFRISDSVRRYGWNGGNVVWRIADPRGFELEISSANLQKIIESAGIQPGGLISGKCVWGRVAGVNILIPDSTPEWQKMVEDQTKLDANKNVITTTDVAIGDLVERKSGTTTGQAIYLGKVYVRVREETKESKDAYKEWSSRYSYHRRDDAPKTKYQEVVKGPYHLLCYLNDKKQLENPLKLGSYEISKANPVVAVLNRGQVSAEECEQAVRKQNGYRVSTYGYMDIVGLSRNKDFVLKYVLKDIDASKLIVGQNGDLQLDELYSGQNDLVFVKSETEYMAGLRVEVRSIDDAKMRATGCRSSRDIPEDAELNLVGRWIDPKTLGPQNSGDWASLHPRDKYYNGICVPIDSPEYELTAKRIREYAATLNLKRVVAVVDGHEVKAKVR